MIRPHEMIDKNRLKRYLFYPSLVFVVITIFISILWALGIDPDQPEVWAVSFFLTLTL